MAPASGWTTSLRLPRDHYVRLDGNDYSVHPSAVGRRIVVTADLDEGPIIEQDFRRVDHRLSPAELASVGQELEAMALARAVRWHAEHRVILRGRRTIVFD